jgi:hypothetical protein
MLRASQAVAGEIDPLRVVNDAIENGVSVGGIADQLVPFVDWDLAGDDRRSPTVEQQSALLDQRTESRRQRQGGLFARLFRRRPTSKATDPLGR